MIDGNDRGEAIELDTHEISNNCAIAPADTHFPVGAQV